MKPRKKAKIEDRRDREGESIYGFAPRMRQFEEYLRTNTLLSENSILLYVRTMKHFFNQFPKPTPEYLNLFITKGFRNARSYYFKPAVKKYLKFIGQEEIYEQLTPVKVKSRKKFGTYLSEEEIIGIINRIEKPKFRDIAMLQFKLGARAMEILTIKEENIDFSGESIRIKIVGKGDKSRVVFLSKQYENLLTKYKTEKNKGYLFFDKEWETLPPKEQIIKFNGLRTNQYYPQLKNVYSTLGTHDLRRNFAEILRSEGNDLMIIKQALGHSSIQTTEKYFNENPERLKEAMMTFQEGKIQ